MRLLRTFEEFLEEGIVMGRSPDLARAKSLVEESEKKRGFLGEMLSKIQSVYIKPRPA